MSYYGIAMFHPPYARTSRFRVWKRDTSARRNPVVSLRSHSRKVTAHDRVPHLCDAGVISNTPFTCWWAQKPKLFSSMVPISWLLNTNNPSSGGDSGANPERHCLFVMHPVCVRPEHMFKTIVIV